MREVVLVACSKSKLGRPAPARDLYRGELFRKSVAWAEQRGLEWAVLSAKHGLVLPGQVLEPYTLTLSSGSAEGPEAKMGRDERQAWARRANAELRAAFPGRRFTALLGREYLPALDGLEFKLPLEGMAIGERLAWLKKEVRDYGQLDTGA